MSSLTPNCDLVFINKNAKLSVEYAKARNAIEEDFKTMFRSNQAMAKKVRKEYKTKVVAHMDGKVSWAEKDKGGKKHRYLIVTFPDHTVATL
jgi:hypothetical protein